MKWVRTKSCIWGPVRTLTSKSRGPNDSFSITPWLLDEMSDFCTSSSVVDFSATMKLEKLYIQGELILLQQFMKT